MPFCGIGVADSFNMLLDRDDIMATPLLRDRAKRSLENIPQARAGGAEQGLELLADGLSFAEKTALDEDLLGPLHLGELFEANLMVTR